eukprot:1224481-Rhodomonas_salina.12
MEAGRGTCASRRLISSFMSSSELSTPSALTSTSSAPCPRSLASALVDTHAEPNPKTPAPPLDTHPHSRYGLHERVSSQEVWCVRRGVRRLGAG